VRELIDCHIHTHCCGHATGSVEEMVAAAGAVGLTGVVFSEHLPLPDDLDPLGDLAPSAEAFADYAARVRSAANVAAPDAIRANGKPMIMLGAEADWLPWRLQDTERQLAIARGAGVQVLLGSVHFLDGWAFDNPASLDEWERRDVDEVWRAYFERWCDAARSGLFDVMAHPDLPKKFGHRPTFDAKPLYREAACAAAEGGVFVEVSTAGLRKPVGELYPGPELLAAFAEAGVGVTVGSDAHAPSEVGFKIAETYTVITKAGYERAAFPLGSGKARWVAL